MHGNHTHFRDIYPDIVTLPQHFKNHGYHAQSMGKNLPRCFSQGSSITKADTFGDEPSWSVPTFRPGPRYYYTEEGIAAAKGIYQKVYKPKDPAADDWTKSWSSDPPPKPPRSPTMFSTMVRLPTAPSKRFAIWQNLTRRFFSLSVSLSRTHRTSRRRNTGTSTMRTRSRSPMTPPANPTLRKFPCTAPANCGATPTNKRKARFPETDQREVRHAYLACISYIDAQIGRVLDELDAQDLAKDTIVVLWSDHGYHLGEKNLWGKTTNFELDTVSR